MAEVYIYKLECTKNGCVYIGKTMHPTNREGTHMSNLRRGKHPVKLMQADFDRYGEDAFTFTILEKVKRTSNLNHGVYQYTDALREKELMLQYKSNLPEYGYNYNDHYFRPTWGPHRPYKHTTDWMPKKERYKQWLAEC